MNIEPSLLAIIITVPVIILMTYAIYHFGYFIYNWHKVISNVTNKYASIMGPFLLLSSSNFNKTGQESLTRSAHHFRRFFYSMLPIITVAIIGAIVKSNAN